MIAAIQKQLQSEASMLENFTILKQEFLTRKQSIEPWLEEKPLFTEQQENRKVLRSLKSKLRHLQADKLDLEEVCVIAWSFPQKFSRSKWHVQLSLNNSLFVIRTTLYICISALLSLLGRYFHYFEERKLPYLLFDVDMRILIDKALKHFYLL